MVYFRKGRQWRFHGLKRPRVRQDWHKNTLYNLSRLRVPNTASRTFFQQKWTAKAMARAYHAEQLGEKKWERLFDRRTPAVVSMDAKALAEDSGTFFSAGRGRGKKIDPKLPKSQQPKLAVRPQMMPYMQMVFHPTERRLDTAIFRALFASSSRQARQLVVHGHVKVNGKTMIYPGYMLNPGDMFQVNPEHVLELTGEVRMRNKTPISTKRTDGKARSKKIRELYRKRVEAADTVFRAKKEAAFAAKNTQQKLEELEGLDDEPSLEDAMPDENDPLKDVKKSLLDLRAQAVNLEETPPKGTKLSAKQKQQLRAFRKVLKSKLSRASTLEPSALEELKTEWKTLSAGIKDPENKSSHKATNNALAKHEGTSKEEEVLNESTSEAAAKSTYRGRKVGKKLRRRVIMREVVRDVRAEEQRQTWQPKAYMSPFAFIPRYLEVNFAICSAVYLRHPVVRPGLAEVPTPFHPETGQLAFNWYLRRR